MPDSLLHFRQDVTALIKENQEHARLPASLPRGDRDSAKGRLRGFSNHHSFHSAPRVRKGVAFPERKRHPLTQHLLPWARSHHHG